MARYRNRYSKDGFCRTMIVIMLVLSGMDFFLLSLLMHLRGKSAVAALLIGTVLLLRGLVWIFEDRPGHRPMNTIVDVITVGVLMALVFVWISFLARSWMVMVVLLIETVYIISYYLRHRPRN